MLFSRRHSLTACLLFGATLACALPKATGQTKHRSESKESGILYGDNFAYSISAPDEWVMDDETARAAGLSVVFYRQGESWQQGKATMYVNVIGRQKHLTVKDVISDDIIRFKKRNPKMKVTQDVTLQTRDKRTAITYAFGQVNANAFAERVAYVEMPTVILLITLTSKTAKDYASALADHAALVNSIAFITSKVEIKKDK